MAELSGWFPVASSEDLPLRHVFQAKLFDREMAIWRADDGNVNVWENRCLHRGVRLSIGVNEGLELKCQYHGWRYANKTAGCIYIPAHPANAPARQITNRTYPAVERFGLVWTTLEKDLPFDAAWPDGDWSVLRAIPVHAGPDAVAAALCKALGAVPRPDIHAFAFALSTLCEAPVLALLQPQDSGRTVVRCLLSGGVEMARRLAAQANAALTRFRNIVEAEASLEAVESEPVFEPVASELAEPPAASPDAITVRVERKWQVAEGITGLTIVSTTGSLPAFQPGAHIDVTLPTGVKRQYSITDGPGTWKSWTIAVKNEANSRGGSRFIAETLRQGDLLSVSEPRNNFPLRRDAAETLLIAGGIGVTPLLAMARALAAVRSGYHLHVFARSETHVPLADQLDGLSPAVTRHLALDPAQVAKRLAEVIGPHAPGRQIYTCGPGGMTEAVLAIAEELGWPEEIIHFENFNNDRVIDTSSAFAVDLARSALSIDVRAGESLLSVLRAHGVELPSACERGACGTCKAEVIEGTPDHQDAYLSKGERASNRHIITCVSRSRTPRLVLDL